MNEVPAEWHALVRTNKTGEKFIGRCFQCGARDLSLESAFEKCPNPTGYTAEESLIIAIEEVWSNGRN